MVPSAGFAPAPRRSPRRVLTDDTTKGVGMEMEPPVIVAPTSTALQERCLSGSATEAREMVRYASAALASRGWKPRMFLLHQ